MLNLIKKYDPDFFIFYLREKERMSDLGCFSSYNRIIIMNYFLDCCFLVTNDKRRDVRKLLFMTGIFSERIISNQDLRPRLRDHYPKFFVKITRFCIIFWIE